MVEADYSLPVAVLGEIQTDLRQQLPLLLQLTDAVRRHDRRFDVMDRRFDEVDRRFNEMSLRLSETRDEIELMVKSELMGRLTHFETQGNERLAQLDDRLKATETAPR